MAVKQEAAALWNAEELQTQEVSVKLLQLPAGSACSTQERMHGVIPDGKLEGAEVVLLCALTPRARAKSARGVNMNMAGHG